MYREYSVAALVPAYNEERFVGDVVRRMPAFVDAVIVVDDASTDATADVVRSINDSRVTLIQHDSNLGLGASLCDAHIAALALGSNISVVMAGDGQMDPAYLPALLDPLIDAGYSFTKGNRFFSPASTSGMPPSRLFGNVVLTFLTKAATGYWGLTDPQNGYTALTREAQMAIDWTCVAKDYSFENDVIAKLGSMRARILDVDIPAVYGDEVSDIRLTRVVPDILRTLRRAFWRRFWYQHVLRSFSPIAVFSFAGLALLLWSIALGVWVLVHSLGIAQASTATVMLVVLPMLMSFMLLLAAWVIDIVEAPQ